jgi:multidrug efflux pump subunit AcrA (membrane-fusion protein)
MDIVRAPQKKTGRNIAIGAGAAVVILGTIALSSLDPAARTVQRVAILIDSVRQGDVIREVRGPGTLVPEQIRFITAQASARVDRKSVESGDRVGAGQVLLEMSNPDLQIQTMQAEQQVRQAQIELLNLKTNLRTQAADPTSELRCRMADALQAAGARLRDDPALGAKAEELIESGAQYVAEHFHEEIAGLVSGTISRWDGQETSRRLELLLGPDLQFIRINGTVVGALAGLAIHGVADVLG